MNSADKYVKRCLMNLKIGYHTPVMGTVIVRWDKCHFSIGLFGPVSDKILCLKDAIAVLRGKYILHTMQTSMITTKN